MASYDKFRKAHAKAIKTDAPEDWFAVSEMADKLGLYAQQRKALDKYAQACRKTGRHA